MYFHVYHLVEFHRNADRLDFACAAAEEDQASGDEHYLARSDRVVNDRPQGGGKLIGKKEWNNEVDIDLSPYLTLARSWAHYRSLREPWERFTASVGPFIVG